MRLPAQALAFLTVLCPSLALAQGVKVEYYHLDGIGNVLAVTDRSGAVVEQHDYLPFGQECTTGSCAPIAGTNTKEFTGKERDAETGLDYFGARYYGANIGRFTTVDPAYTINDNLADPQRSKLLCPRSRSERRAVQGLASIG